jgi:hypothetical protein
MNDFNFKSEWAIRNVQENQVGHISQIYADDVNL